MKLLVIESPNKSATIKKYLGSDWEVFATKGHIIDLPTKTLGVDVKNNFEPKYEIMADKKDVIKQLKQKADKAEAVFIATDPDREGEAIGWHVANVLNKSMNEACRVEFNEITKDVILKSLSKPRVLNLNLIDAQQARRVLDRLVGYKLSPILCKKIQNNLSAGRVQSAALKIIVDREREILNFKPEEYWNIFAQLEKPENKPQFKAQLISKNSKKIKIENKNNAEQIVKDLQSSQFFVKSVTPKLSKSHAPAPFTTSTMQQDAFNKLSMNLSQTTRSAQELYEGVELGEEGKVALVTYIRTDSVRVSEEFVNKAREYIVEKFGKDFVPEVPNHYKSKGAIQDAHEAIRPVNLNRTPENVRSYLSPENYKLYKLIYERFLASQMSEATYDTLTCEISAGEYLFKVVGKTPKFLGFTAIYLEHKTEIEDEEKDTKLPNLLVGDVLKLISTNPEQKFTKPSPRFTEATLIKAMEEKGIGRPATYAPTIMVLSKRKYVEKEQKKFFKPTELGLKVTDYLQKYFNDIINVNFTAEMEEKLDSIEEGGKDWHKMISDFYIALLPQLKEASGAYKEVKEPEVTDVKCEKCGAFMVVKEGRYGKFLACPNFPTCKNIKSLKTEKPVAKCPKCGKDVYQRKSKTGKIYFSCEDYKNCKFMSWDLPLQEKCEKCGSYLLKKIGKTAVTIKCSNENCDYKRIEKPEVKDDSEQD